MIYMLDTNIIIYLLKNKPPEIRQRVNALDANSKLCMSFITYAHDLWIACHALACGAILVTNNVREFERVVGLKIENW